MLHLSYVKPHWPYMAPAPYHARYSWTSACPSGAQRASSRSRIPCSPHIGSRRNARTSCATKSGNGASRPIRDWCSRSTIISVGCGTTLEMLGRFDDTLIVFTADHGDFLGDHWLGEKELFYDTVQRCR